QTVHRPRRSTPLAGLGRLPRSAHRNSPVAAVRRGAGRGRRRPALRPAPTRPGHRAGPWPRPSRSGAARAGPVRPPRRSGSALMQPSWQIPRPALFWLLATQTVVAVLQAGHLPLWLLGAGALVFGWRILIYQ